MSVQIINHTVAVFLSMPEVERENYNFVFRNSDLLKPIDNIGLLNFNDLSFGLVKDLQSDVAKGMTYAEVIKYFTKLSNKSENWLLNECSIIDFLQTKQYLVQEILKISDFEASMLGGSVTKEAAKAGVSRFDKYQWFNQIYSLTGGDITKHQAVLDMKYSDAFLYLCYQKDHADFLNAAKYG